MGRITARKLNGGVKIEVNKISLFVWSRQETIKRKDRKESY